jgi:hypothetical protein
MNEDDFFSELYSVNAVDGLWLDLVVQGACMNATIHPVLIHRCSWVASHVASSNVVQ